MKPPGARHRVDPVWPHSIDYGVPRKAATASATPPGISSHVYFEGQDDSISLCGNVYLPGHTSGNAGTPARSSTLRPLYDYDANPAAQLSNITIADNYAPQQV